MGAKGSKFFNCKAAEDHVVPPSECAPKPPSEAAPGAATVRKSNVKISPPPIRPEMNPRSESLELSYLPQVHREGVQKDSWGTLSVGDSLGLGDSSFMTDGSSMSYSSSNISSNSSSCHEHSSQTARTIPLDDEDDSQGTAVKEDCKRQRKGEALTSAEGMKEEQRRCRKQKIELSRRKLHSEEQNCNAVSTPAAAEEKQKIEHSRRLHSEEQNQVVSTLSSDDKPVQQRPRKVVSTPPKSNEKPVQQQRRRKACRKDPPGSLQRFQSTRATAQT